MRISLQREWISLWRSKSIWIMPCLFYGLVLILMMFAVGPFDTNLKIVLPRLFLVALLLALFLQTEQLFKSDYENGYLAQYALSQKGFGFSIGVKLFVQFCLQIIPLVLIVLLATLLGDIDYKVGQALLISVALSLPILFLITAFSAALTLSLKQTGLLNAIILVPFYIPVLLFAESIILRAQWNEPYIAYVYLLLALLILSIVLLPYLIMYCLRISLE